PGFEGALAPGAQNLPQLSPSESPGDCTQFGGDRLFFRAQGADREKNTGAGIVRWKKASNKFVHCPSKIMMLTKVTVGSCREALMKSNERVRPGVPYIATEQTRRLVAGCHKRSVLKRAAEHTFPWIDRTLLGVTGGIEELKGIARNVAEEIQT